eukprot:TRINITY_DN16268_c0_g1_i1.p1 TRINITY_DN16268_c0_g1~~TRINITY_DN16268_c0_g1_i1.p1  ORF type:complete len:933 (+),score=201.03 TRINITY_DN16268_c0_g1_i1:196-2994(+)
MLKLVEEFNLQIAFSLIPPEDLKVPKVIVQRLLQDVPPEDISFKYPFLEGIKEPVDVVFNRETCSLNLVGTDKEGGILVARNCIHEGNLITVIDCFNFKKYQLKTLYRHPEPIVCVSCSLNYDNTLLAFTFKNRRRDPKRPQLIQEYYESSLTEITGPKPSRHTFNKCTEQPQSTMFPGGSEKKKGGIRLDLLCYFYGKKFGIYEIPCKEQAGTVGIVENPIIKETVRVLVWYQWSPHKPILYYIEQTNKSRLENDTLTCHAFTSKTPTILFRTPIAPYSRGDRIVIVKLDTDDETNIVICKQHATAPNYPFVQVSLLILKHESTIDFNIPLAKLKLSHVTVYFDSVGQLLLVYIPGYFFQLVNVHEPALGLCFFGSEYATPVPRQVINPEISVDIYQFPMLKELSRNASRSHAFLDIHSGSIYRYYFNRETILRIFSKNSVQSHIQAFNLAAIHLEDMELVEEIIIQISKYHTKNASSELFSEYLLAMSYLDFIQQLRELSIEKLKCTMSQLSQWILFCTSLFPLTTLPNTFGTQGLSKTSFSPRKKHKTQGRLNFANDYLLSSTRKDVNRSESPMFSTDFIHPKSPSTGSLPSSPLSTTLHGNFSKFLGRIFEDSDPVFRVQTPNPTSTSAPLPTFLEKPMPLPFPVPKSKLGKVSPTNSSTLSTSSSSSGMNAPLTDYSQKHTEALGNYLLNVVPKDIKRKNQCLEIATLYRNVQESRTMKLLACLKAERPSNEDGRKLFDRLCNLHIALEEMGFPIPNEFQVYLTELGFKYLSRSMFLQFVERGIFEITAQFVEKLLPQLSSCDEDNTFKYLLLSKLQEEPSIQLLERDTFSTESKYTSHQEEFLMEYKVRYHKFNEKTTNFINMDEIPDSDFLPLTTYLVSLKSSPFPPQELQWLVNTAKIDFQNDIWKNEPTKKDRQKDSTLVYEN